MYTFGSGAVRRESRDGALCAVDRYGLELLERSLEMKKLLAFCVLFVALSTFVCARLEAAEVSATPASDAADREVLFQVSLLQGLMLGDFEGSLPIGELKKHGDIGLGTFTGVNGEMIVLGDSVYRAAGDGSVEVASDDERVPFAAVTFFDADESEALDGPIDFAALRKRLDAKVAELGVNRFYFIRIHGAFSKMNVRSALKQEPPYNKTLVQVMEKDQRFFNYENITGTVVGLYCPAYMSMLNAAGWHMHFISDDRAKGGHVLGLEVKSAKLEWDYTNGFKMQLPESKAFADFNLQVDQSEDIKKVETNDKH